MIYLACQEFEKHLFAPYCCCDFGKKGICLSLTRQVCLYHFGNKLFLRQQTLEFENLAFKQLNYGSWILFRFSAYFKLLFKTTNNVFVFLTFWNVAIVLIDVFLPLTCKSIDSKRCTLKK